MKGMRGLAAALVFALVGATGGEAEAQRAQGGGLVDVKAPIVVALLPFKVNGPAELEYLGPAIPDVLASRLATLTAAEQGAVTAALSRRASQPVTEQVAREVGRESGAQFVVLGSITAVGERLSLDARILPVTSGRAATIYIQGDSFDRLLTHIASLALEIDKGISGVQAFLGTDESATPTPNGSRGTPSTDPGILTKPGRTKVF
jgi:TolB-like protein